MSSCLGIIGEKCRLEVGCQFVEGLFSTGNGSIRHPVIPHLGEGDSTSLAHLVKSGHDFVGVGGVD